MFSQYVNELTMNLSNFTAGYLMPFMVVCFLIGAGLKAFNHFVASRQLKISNEVEQRVHRHLDGEYEDANYPDFHSLAKALFNRTYNEHFLMRKKNRRRRFDSTATFLDRIFYVDAGAHELFDDMIKQTRLHQVGGDPNFRGIAGLAFSGNKYFNNLFGLFSMNAINGVLAVLPGLFIIGGLFGTFLGIIGAIPQLKGMDPSQMEATKLTLGAFLDQMAFSMNTSIVGIFLSALFTVVNSIFATKSIQRDAYLKFVNLLEFIWRNTHSQGVSSSDGEKDGITTVLISPSSPPPPPVPSSEEEDDDEWEYEEYDEDEEEEEEEPVVIHQGYDAGEVENVDKDKFEDLCEDDDDDEAA